MVRELAVTKVRQYKPNNRVDYEDFIYFSGKVDGEKSFVLMLTGHGEPDRKPE